jgi:hypothetical protein
MTFRKYIILICLGTIVALGGWILVLAFVSPAASPIIAPVLFYLTLFFSLFGLFTLAGLILRLAWKKEEILYRQMNFASRQAILLSLLLVSTLFLQSFRSLFNWTIWCLVVVFVALEVILMAWRRRAK